MFEYLLKTFGSKPKVLNLHCFWMGTSTAKIQSKLLNTMHSS
jgi:hypothetical protein